MGFRLVPKLMTLNDLEQRNGHCQVTRAEMTQGQTWLSIRMNILVRLVSCRVIIIMYVTLVWWLIFEFRKLFDEFCWIYTAEARLYTVFHIGLHNASSGSDIIGVSLD